MTTAAPELLALKRCGRCRQDKPLEAFTRDRAKADGLDRYCRECKREHNAAWRAAHPDYFRNRHAEAPHHGWQDSYARRARAYGNPVIIEPFTREDLVERYGNECWLCGGPWNQLDHVIAVAVGGFHTLENCRPSCGHENAAQGNEAAAAKRRREARRAATYAGRGDLALAELRGQITTAELLAQLATGTA